MKSLENLVGGVKKGLKSLAYAGLVGVALVGGARETKAELINSNSIVKYEIEYYIQTDKEVYNLGEDVEMMYRVKNLRDEDVRFDFSDQVQHYFTVQEHISERLMWKWPIVGFPAFSYFVLGPNESKQYIEYWDMKDHQGTFSPSDDTIVIPGFYKVTGSLSPHLLPSHVPVSVQIDIIPEPSSLTLLAIGCLAGAGLYGLRRNKGNKKL